MSITRETYRILRKVARHIEENPETYRFTSLEVPKCGIQGCLLGWMAVFHPRLKESATVYNAGLKLLGMKENQFYEELNDLYGNTDWIHSAEASAAALRQFADNHYKGASK